MKYILFFTSIFFSANLYSQNSLRFVFDADSSKTIEYEGKVVNGKANGFGKGVFSNGNIYEGEWKNNKLHGSGKYFWIKDSTVHIGKFVNNAAEGKGKLTFKDGREYEGAFKNFLREGNGVQKWKNGDTYTGEWKKDKMDGSGKMQYASGSIYSGEWANNKYNGFGKMVYNSGDVYSGYWVNGMKEGNGKYIWKEKYVYDGNWKADKRQGKGILTTDNKTTYNGEWENDFMNGTGEYYYSNGDRYLGALYKDKKNGSGVLYKSNGEKIVGNWKDDEFQKPKAATFKDKINDVADKVMYEINEGVAANETGGWRLQSSKNFIINNQRYYNDETNCFQFYANKSRKYQVVLIAAEKCFIEVVPELAKYTTKKSPNVNKLGAMYEKKDGNPNAFAYIVELYEGSEFFICPKSADENVTKFEGKILLYVKNE